MLDMLVSCYNEAVYWSTGTAPSLLSDRDVLCIWEKIGERQAGTMRATDPPIYSVDQTVMIRTEKMRFAKGLEQKWTLELFRITKVLRRSPRPVYELEDLRGESMDGEFYAEALTPVNITRRTEYLVDKILELRIRHSIRNYLVRWRG